MYFVLSQEEYDDKVSIDALRQYVRVAIKEYKKQMHDYENKENIKARTYYSGKIDALIEIYDYLN